MECRVKLEDGTVDGILLGLFPGSKVIDPSPIRGGHPGGIISYPVAVVRVNNELKEVTISSVFFDDEKTKKDRLLHGMNDVRIRQGLEPLSKEDPLLSSINSIRMHMGWKPLVSVEKSRESLEEIRKTMEKHGEYFK